MADPHNPGYFESFTCSSVYRRDNSFADPNLVKVRNYYGKGLFSPQPRNANSASSSGFRDINFEDLVDAKNQVWRADTVNPFSSFRSRFDTETRTSS